MSGDLSAGGSSRDAESGAWWTDARVRAALELGAGHGPAAIAGVADAGSGQVAYAGIGTDTRALAPGTLFVALRGERFDAHDFLHDALARGATGAVVSRVPEGVPEGLRVYVVPDTLVALGQLARYYRRRLVARVCAIAGTNGKTTTKEMTRAALAASYQVHATHGNLNNLVGTPLTLLGAPLDAEVLVVEVGTNAPGEIALLRDIVEPDAAIITRLAEEHLEGLGDITGVLREETSLLEGLPPEGIAVVSDDPPELPSRARELVRRVRVAGLSERADPDLRAEDIRVDEEGRVAFRWGGVDVQLPLRGRFNAANALLALGLAAEWGVEPARAAAALADVAPAKMRAEVHRYGDLRVIVDCYNANPASMEGALELLTAMPRGAGRVAVVGSMLELGPTSAELHERVARALAAAELDLIVATGAFVPAFGGLAAALGERLVLAEDAPAAAAPLLDRLRGGEVVLLKGSRGVALERLLPHIQERWREEAHVG